MQSPRVQIAGKKSELVWQLVEMLDEVRRHPRLPIDLKVALVTDRGTKCSARVINISPDGFQMRCDVESAKKLHPKGGKIDAENGPHVNAALALPIGEAHRTLATRCRLLYLTTVDSEPRCVVGLRFVQLDTQSERIIIGFFADQLALEAEEAALA